MRIGAFLLILLIALVALGYLLSDSIHMREDMQALQNEFDRLSLTAKQAERDKQQALEALQAAEQDKQATLTALQNTSQDLKSCHQQVEQMNQAVAQAVNENTTLKEKNRVLVASLQPSDSGMTSAFQGSLVPSMAFGLIAILTLGFGSVVMVTRKHTNSSVKDPVTEARNFVYLSEAEIEDLIHRRRQARNPHRSDP